MQVYVWGGAGFGTHIYHQYGEEEIVPPHCVRLTPDNVDEIVSFFDD
jgi:hypothetical protein